MKSVSSYLYDSDHFKQSRAIMQIINASGTLITPLLVNRNNHYILLTDVLKHKSITKTWHVPFSIRQ